MKRYIPEKIAIWKAGTEYSFDPNTGLNKHIENARVTIVEFADFKCPHCKVASATLELFLNGRSDVNFIFKPYPLDGSCNAGLPQKGDGSRCTLAGFTLCAEKLNKKGFEMLHWLFERQEKIMAAVKTVGADRLTPIRQALGEEYSWDEIKLVLAKLKSRNS